MDILVPLALTFLAGLSTVLGSLLGFWMKLEKKHLDFALGFSAGVMIYISFVELFAGGIESLGFGFANLAFFGGIVFIMAIDFFVPHHYIAERAGRCKGGEKMMKAGLLTFVGIAIHNFPEGVAVFMGSVDSLTLGVSIAIAIAIHNIPEGIAISMPIYSATKDRNRAMKYSFIAGMAEPIGALIGFFFLAPFLNPTVLAATLAFVGGIMVFIAFDELLPICVGVCDGKEGHTPILGVLLGMVLMAVSLLLI